jgi:hypothetical protein
MRTHARYEVQDPVNLEDGGTNANDLEQSKSFQPTNPQKASKSSSYKNKT